MKNKGKLFATILLLVCILSMTFTTLLVQAPSTGKGELTINITGEGYVTATNVKNRKFFTFDSDTPTNKVGGGTFNLVAITDDDGWEFFSWTGPVIGDPDDNSVDFKMVKGATITAIFKIKTYTITASASEEGFINPLEPQTVNHGDDSLPYTFGLNEGYEDDYHISAIVIVGTDDDPLYLNTFETSYTFEAVTADHTIEVIISANGASPVPEGSDVSIGLASTAGLTFESTLGGIAFGGIEDYPLAAGAWEITITFEFTGEVTVTLKYDENSIPADFDENDLFLIRADSIEALRSDLNWDFNVDGDDVSDLANLIKWEIYDHAYDLALPYGVLDEADIHVVNSNIGATLEQIWPDDIDTVNHIITFTTESFSIWGVRGAWR